MRSAEDAPRRVCEVLERGARRMPQAIALHAGDDVWTYGMLRAAACGIAGELAARGVRSGDRVLIVAENGVAQIAAFFAAGELGAWPALVNARSSAREIDAIAAHARPRVCAYTVGNSPEAAAHAARAGAREAAGDGGPGASLLALTGEDVTAAPEPGPIADAVGALIYTSGTTGAPKGVMATHAGLLNFAARSVEVRRLGPTDVVFGALPMSHIFGIATILLTTLHAGGSVLLQPRFDPEATTAALRAGRITALHGVPSLYSRLLTQLEHESLRGPFAALRYAYAGGGTLDLALKQRVEETLGLPLHHGYGMTEYAGSMFVTHVDRPRADVLPGELAPDCEVRFVDDAGGDAPVGEPGEIWVRGPGTMLGYYRAPELTRETLTADGWLRTGDLGYLLPDGALKIVGRARDIIKRSGYTVYPQEVEHELAAHPAVRQAGVIGIPADSGGEAIVAFVEARTTDAQLDSAELLTFLRERLSHYKCPQHIVQVAELPLTASGKVRKDALRELWRARR